jgi:hypothetical protein
VASPPPLARRSYLPNSVNLPLFCFRFPFLTGPAPLGCCTSLIVPPLDITTGEQLVLPPRTITTLSLPFNISSSSPNHPL